MLSLGIDAWWLDATEPENDDLHNRTIYLGSGDEYRLVYPLFVTGTVYDGSRKDEPDKRVMILSRSAFLGEQRYSVRPGRATSATAGTRSAVRLPPGLTTPLPGCRTGPPTPEASSGPAGRNILILPTRAVHPLAGVLYLLTADARPRLPN